MSPGSDKPMKTLTMMRSGLFAATKIHPKIFKFIPKFSKYSTRKLKMKLPLQYRRDAASHCLRLAFRPKVFRRCWRWTCGIHGTPFERCANGSSKRHSRTVPPFPIGQKHTNSKEKESGILGSRITFHLQMDQSLPQSRRVRESSEQMRSELLRRLIWGYPC